jgi:hypothetical protein
VPGVAEVLARHAPVLLAIPGVEGVEITRTDIGEDAIGVMIADASVRPRIAERIEGFPVVTKIVPRIDAFPGR